MAGFSVVDMASPVVDLPPPPQERRASDPKLVRAQ